MYLEVSLLRGALQGVGNYKAVGISLSASRRSGWCWARCWRRSGSSVTGAYLGSLFSYVAMSALLLGEAARLRGRHRRGGDAADAPHAGHEPGARLWLHVKRAWAPIVGLVVIAVLQNIDLIAAKHQFTPRPPARMPPLRSPRRC